MSTTPTRDDQLGPLPTDEAVRINGGTKAELYPRAEALAARGWVWAEARQLFGDVIGMGHPLTHKFESVAAAEKIQSEADAGIAALVAALDPGHRNACAVHTWTTLEILYVLLNRIVEDPDPRPGVRRAWRLVEATLLACGGSLPADPGIYREPPVDIAAALDERMGREGYAVGTKITDL